MNLTELNQFVIDAQYRNSEGKLKKLLCFCSDLIDDISQ